MIESVTLRNFKCFEDQTIPARALTLLTGLNGTGKSSVLQSLLLLRQSHQQGLLRDKGLALNGDFVRIGKGTDALFEGAKDEFIGLELGLTGGATARWRFSYDRESDVIGLAESAVNDDLYRTNLFNDDFCYLNAERTGPRTAFEMSEFLVRQHRQVGVHGEYAAHFLSVFGREGIRNEKVLHGQAESRKLRDQVEAWLGEISPGTRLRFNAHGSIDLVSLEFAFVTGKDVSSYYRGTNVGFGITYTLPVLVALVGARPGSMVLIENPEAHLHPKGQTKVGELLARVASSGVQVLVESHSDHVLNGIRLAVRKRLISPGDVAIHFFERVQDGESNRSRVISPRVDADGRIDQWPEYFFDEWDRALEDMLLPPG